MAETSLPEQHNSPEDSFAELDTTIEGDTFRSETSSGARQKRKRTSPRDHAVLEAAYQKNSKPDKEDRLNLVQQVDLGEKEVQIWFQNRRQNDRRKAKPLLPHELIPHFRNGVPEEARTLSSPEASQDEGTITMAPPARNASPETQQQEIQAARLSNEGPHPTPRSTINSSPSTSLQQTPSTAVTHSTPPSSFERPAPQTSNSALDTASPAARSPTSPSRLTMKRSHEQMTGTEPPSAANASNENKSLRRTSSFVRLAISADGSVKVRVNDETTPSPPKERPPPPPNMVSRRNSGIQRTQSDVSSTFSFSDTMGPVRGAVGRSRDARTWEFYCDRSARSSLAARAEQEATGTASGALGLIRSASQRKPQILTPNPTRHNNNNTRRNQNTTKPKPSLSRTKSSMARLQTSKNILEDNPSKPPSHSHSRRISGSDSDKENWLPGTRNAVHDLRRTAPTTQRNTILQQQQKTPHSHPSPNLVSAQDQENRPVTKAKGDDLDCVQGLLSLSQGAWR